MSHKEIKLYDDSVIKLTIKQGLEQERFGVNEIKDGIGSRADGSTVDLLDNTEINSVSGSLVSGELGYTRDTNRLFIGNISDQSKNVQQTLGGVLSGNKYLGYVDSDSSLQDLLSENSEYRSYNFAVNGETKITEDGKWPRLTHYNETYDAYDGDYMYDIYRNALILFDHNIKQPKDSENLIPKRKTPLYPKFKDIEGKESIYNYTNDMYGDGYVLFYNIVPDGETLTFADKIDNYNILKICGLPKDLFNEDDFKIDDGKIYIKNKSSNNGGGNDNGNNGSTGSEFDTPYTSYILKNDGEIIKQSTILTDDLEGLFNDLNNISYTYTDDNSGEVIKCTGIEAIEEKIKYNNSRIEKIDATIKQIQAEGGVSSGGGNTIYFNSYFPYPDYAQGQTILNNGNTLTITKESLAEILKLNSDSTTEGSDSAGDTNTEGDDSDSTDIPPIGDDSYYSFILISGTNKQLTHSYETIESSFDTDGNIKEEKKSYSKMISLSDGTILLPIHITEDKEKYIITGTGLTITIFPAIL